MNKAFLYILKLLFASILLIYLFKSENLTYDIFLNIFSKTNIFYSLFLFFLFYILSVFRWYYILKNLNTAIKFKECLKYDLSSIIFNYIIPIGELSGEIVRGFYLYNEKKINKKIVILSLIYDRGSGAITLILSSLLALPFLLHYKYQDIGLILFVGLILFLFFMKSLIINFLYFVLRKFNLIRYFKKKINYKKIWINIFISLTSFLFYFLALLLLFEIKYIEINIIFLLLLIFPIGLLMIALPISPGGIGVGSASFIILSEFFFGTKYFYLENGILVLQIFFLVMGVLSYLLILLFSKPLKFKIKK